MQRDPVPDLLARASSLLEEEFAALPDFAPLPEFDPQSHAAAMARVLDTTAQRLGNTALGNDEARA